MVARIIIPDVRELNWRGAWLPDAEYVEGDIVGYLGSSYRASRDTLNEPPDSNPGTWEIVAERGMSAGSYVYERVNPATIWLIPHTLSYDPAGIEVEDEFGNKRNPAISYSETESGRIVMLTFLKPTKGKARLS